MEGNKKNDAEEEKEIAKAGLLLCSWKNLMLDPIEAETLEKQKQETLLQRIRSRQNRKHHQATPPEIGQPNNNVPGSDNNPPPVLAPNGECSSRPSEKESTESDVKDDQ